MTAAQVSRVALVCLLTVNGLYLVARSFIGDEPHAPLQWTVAFALAYAVIASIVVVRGEVSGVAAKIVVWMSFAFMVLTILGDPETPEPKNYGSFMQYAELAWAAVFCLGSLYLINRIARRTATRPK